MLLFQTNYFILHHWKKFFKLFCPIVLSLYSFFLHWSWFSLWVNPSNVFDRHNWFQQISQWFSGRNVTLFIVFVQLFHNNVNSRFFKIWCLFFITKCSCSSLSFLMDGFWKIKNNSYFRAVWKMNFTSLIFVSWKWHTHLLFRFSYPTCSSLRFLVLCGSPTLIW